MVRESVRAFWIATASIAGGCVIAAYAGLTFFKAAWMSSYSPSRGGPPGVAVIGAATAVQEQKKHLNPMVELHLQKKTVFGRARVPRDAASLPVPRSPRPCQEPPRKTVLPPAIVLTIFALRISAPGIIRRSRSITARSASIPGRIAPVSRSRNDP